MTNFYDGKWHGWNGGECPVHPKSKVNTFFIHNGLVPSTQGEGTISDACGQDWSCVIAFRVVKEYREPRECWAYLTMMFDSLEKAEDFRAQFNAANPGHGYLDAPITHWREVVD